MVQPIKSGRLTGAKVEFLSQGRKVSEVAIPMKANHGYLARTLLWLGILLPFIINLFPSLTFVENKAGARPGGIDPTIVDTGRIAVPGTPNMGAGGSAPSKTTPDKTKDNDKNAPPKTEAEAPVKKLDLRPSGVSASPNRGGGAPAKGNRGAPDKSKDNAMPPKKDADVPKKDTAALVLASFIVLQPPTKDDKHPIGDPSPIKKDGETPRQDGEKLNPGPGKNSNYANIGSVNYTDEEAIGAWVRSKLVQTGYQTKLVQRDPEADNGIFSFPRRYEITQDSTSEWSTKRVTAVGLYYCEPVLRFLYRFVIEFPKKIPFGDLILALGVLALGAFVWLFTGPNRRKVKGSVMDIRLAGN